MRHLLDLCLLGGLAACLVTVPHLAVAGPDDANDTSGWIPTCTKNKSGAVVGCRVVKRIYLNDPDKPRLLLSIQLRRPKGRIASLRLQLPTRLDLRTGVSFAVMQDDSKTSKLAYRSHLQTCKKSGCIAKLPVTAELLTAMKSSKALRVGFANAQKKKVSVTVALKDFAAAYHSLDEALK